MNRCLACKNILRYGEKLFCDDCFNSLSASYGTQDEQEILYSLHDEDSLIVRRDD